MAKKMKKSEGYGPNPADNPVDEYGNPSKNSDNFWKQWDSSKAKRSSTDLRKRTADKKSAQRTALKKWMDQYKKTGMIPKSPTN